MHLIRLARHFNCARRQRAITCTQTRQRPINYLTASFANQSELMHNESLSDRLAARTDFQLHPISGRVSDISLLTL